MLVAEREKEIAVILQSIREIHQFFQDIAMLVVEQGTILDRIDYNIEHAAVRVAEGRQQLEKVCNSTHRTIFTPTLIQYTHTDRWTDRLPSPHVQTYKCGRVTGRENRVGETGEERERERREGERYSDYALTHTLVHSVHGFVSVRMCGTIYAAIIQGPVVCTFS